MVNAATLPFTRASKEMVRELNLATILEALRTEGPLARVALAESTGLSKASVTSLAKELIESGLVRELGVAFPGALGRPSALLDLDPAAGCLLAVEVGVGFAQALLLDFTAQPLWREYVQHPHASATVGLAEVEGLVRRAVEQARATGTRLLGMAAGLPGLVDPAAGVLAVAPNLGWRDVDVRAMFAQWCDCPVFVDNEARLAGLGEYYLGAARDHENVLYVHVSTGVAGAFIARDTPQIGTRGFAGQFGHMTVEPGGLACRCGNFGCWETLVGEQAVLRRRYPDDAERAAEVGEDEDVVDVLSRIADEARAGQPVAVAALDETALYLGIGIGNLVAALDPSIVVVGGTLSAIADLLLEGADEVLQSRRLGGNDGVEIVPAAFGRDAALMGGIATVHRYVLENPSGRLMPGKVRGGE